MKKLILLFSFHLLFITRIEAQDLKSIVRFASQDEARILLSTEDAFTDAWSQFDIDARMQQRGSTRTDLMALITAQALDWTEDEMRSLLGSVANIDARIQEQGFVIDFPDTISFVKTTGEEEGGAVAYTRGTYVILKEEILKSRIDDLSPLIVHELFHVLSRNDPELRRNMYSIIGFSIMPGIEYPESIRNLRITNPDAPQTDSYISLKIDARTVDCMMVLYADRPYEGGSLFEYLRMGFLELKGDGEKSVVQSNGRPVIHPLENVEGFYEQIGNNTAYIIHPEEIMAENFSFAILGNNNLKTPGIVDDIRDLLRKK